MTNEEKIDLIISIHYENLGDQGYDEESEEIDREYLEELVELGHDLDLELRMAREQA